MDKKTSPKPLIDRAKRDMGDAIKSRYREARSLLRTATTGESLARYRVGRLVREIREHTDRYGNLSVGLLAAALGYDEATLHSYARVVESWPDQSEFNELLRRYMPNGSPLSWAHLLELSIVSTRDERERLITDVLTHGLSVRDLVALVRDQDPIPASTPPSSMPNRVRWFIEVCDALERGVHATKKSLARLETSPDALQVLNDAQLALARARVILDKYGSALDAADDRIIGPAGEEGEVRKSVRGPFLLAGIAPVKSRVKP
ncbi:hypothetical protein [Pendulispora albinea]|uniref:Uncharacterized protein n=1 Tax=Pendulispora albinea TaxID=2741071 RepID=A0ABZ2M0I5_9BACT